ncbi:MAG TPA: hypothetical protein EYG66_06130 [Mariprofundaceae bacterium]|nr:hypothetical protein [Mariprofundaceae bacterium]
MKTARIQPNHISRNSFQWILHQALVADERFVYRGLIGSDKGNTAAIEKVAMVKGDADIAQTLDVWAELGIQCLGFFQFEEDGVSQALLDAMPAQYAVLKVRLAEKGRLDLLAHFYDKEVGSVVKLNLDLIEDGQQDTVV